MTTARNNVYLADMQSHKLSVQIGQERRLVLFNQREVNNLTGFQLELDDKGVLHTTFKCVGNFPTFGPVPEDAGSNSAFPLRLHTDADPNDMMLTLLGRPFHLVKTLSIEMTSKKTSARIVFHAPVRKKLLDALVELGVEVEMPGQPLNENNDRFSGVQEKRFHEP